MTDRFTLDVVRKAFLAVADEMFVSLQRTSQSPVIYEVLDFGVGLTDAGGPRARSSRGRWHRPASRPSAGCRLSFLVMAGPARPDT